jgi:hypothetical protein
MMRIGMIISVIVLLNTTISFGQKSLNLILDQFQQEVNSGYLVIEKSVTNLNGIAGQNSIVEMRVFFIKDQKNQLSFIIDNGTQLYIVEANVGKMFRLKDSSFIEIKEFTDLRQYNDLISFWLNPGYLNNVRQNEKMYTLISDSSEATLWRSADSTGNYSFEIGLHGIYPNLVRLDILIRGVNQTKIQTLKYSKINMLSRSEYDNIKQTFMMRINKFDLEN